MAVSFFYQGNPCRTEGTLATLPHPAKGYFIANGFTAPPDRPIQEGDQIWFSPEGQLPSAAAYAQILSARYTPSVYEKLKQAKIAIAGLGGHGSHIALFLARAGVGELLLVDFDSVDFTNLGRQNYTLADLGRPKTMATADHLSAVNPILQVKTAQVKVTAENAPSLFQSYPIVCEAFDQPENKAAFVNALLANTTCTLITGSGMAGTGSANDIHTRRAMGRLYICGDETTDVQEGTSLFASRVAVCAGHQAHMALRLILGDTSP